MVRLIPDFLSNLIVGDTFYFLDENYFHTYDKQREKYDGWKFFCVGIRKHPTEPKVMIDAIGFSDDWENTEDDWPEAWRGSFPANVHIVIETCKDPELKAREWELFMDALKDKIQDAIDEGDEKVHEVVTSRGLQLLYMIELIESNFFNKDEEDDEE